MMKNTTDDFSFVASVGKKDSVLIVGDVQDRLVYDVRKHADKISVVKSVDSYKRNKKMFSRVIFSLDSTDVPAERIVSMGAQATKVDGLFCVVSKSGDFSKVEDTIEKLFPYANVWKFGSSVGNVLVSDVKGSSYLRM